MSSGFHTFIESVAHVRQTGAVFASHIDAVGGWRGVARRTAGAHSATLPKLEATLQSGDHFNHLRIMINLE
jgi:hypothetical protein